MKISKYNVAWGKMKGRVLQSRFSAVAHLTPCSGQHL